VTRPLASNPSIQSGRAANRSALRELALRPAADFRRWASEGRATDSSIPDSENWFSHC